MFLQVNRALNAAASMRCVPIVVWAFDASAKFTRPAADATAIRTAFCEKGRQSESRYAASPMNSAENRLLFTFFCAP